MEQTSGAQFNCSIQAQKTFEKAFHLEQAQIKKEKRNHPVERATINKKIRGLLPLKKKDETGKALPMKSFENKFSRASMLGEMLFLGTAQIKIVDEKGKKKFIEKGQFLIDDELTTRRIKKIEFLPKDLYFVIHFEENTNPGDILEKIVKKEVTIFLPGSSFPSNYEYPLTSDDLVKMF